MLGKIGSIHEEKKLSMVHDLEKVSFGIKKYPKRVLFLEYTKSP